MNKKLIFQLSLFGLAMSVGTVYWIPGNIEPFVWLPIFVFCAYVIAKKCSGNFFLHGFLVSLVNCIWITAAHIILADDYLPLHPEEVEMMTKMPVHPDPRVMMLFVGPIFGVIFGLVLGLFSYIATKLVKR